MMLEIALVSRDNIVGKPFERWFLRRQMPTLRSAFSLVPEYLRTLEVVEQQGWSTRRIVPHGGHQMSLNIAAGLHLGGNESYPDVFQPFGGFADGIAVQEGRVALPEVPGVGFEAKSKLYALMREIAA